MHSSKLHRLKKRWKLVVLFSIIGAIASVVLTLVLPIPLQYRADSEVLILTESRYGVDPYTAAKSAERVGENLAQIVETSDFFAKTFSNGQVELDRTPYQNITEKKRRERWQKNIDASVVFGTSVMTFSAYHEDPDEAKKTVSALTQTMIKNAPEYVGSGISMQVINQPIVTDYPVRPNIIMQILLGAFVGVLLSLFLIFK